MKCLFDFYKFSPFMEEDGGSGGSNAKETETNQTESDKTFSQEEVNRIAAQEKRQGIASVLKNLGFDKEDDAKAFIEKYKEAEENSKTELDKAKDSLKHETESKNAAEAKAEQLERQLKAISAGVSPAHAGDVVILAASKITDKVSFEDALEEVKKAYPSMFSSEDSGNTGTGGSKNGSRKPVGGSSGSGGMGKRLAEQRKASNAAKNDYFNK